MDKNKKSKTKINKFKLISIIIFVLGFLFLAFAIFVYTPWFKNSRYYKIYQAKQTLKTIPESSPMHNAYKRYIDCLKKNQKECIYVGSNMGIPGPILGK